MTQLPPVLSDDALDQIIRQSECRTPLVLIEEDFPVGWDATRLSEELTHHCGIPTESFHLSHSHVLPALLHRLEHRVARGEWLVLTLSPKMEDWEGVLRAVGRFLFTMMPHAGAPNMELFRLLVALPSNVQPPVVFARIAVRPRLFNPRGCGGGVGGDPAGGAGGSPIGPLFHRRRELATGTAAELTRRPLPRPRTAAAAAAAARAAEVGERLRPRSAPGAGEPMGDLRRFEKEVGDAAQKMYAALVRSFHFSECAARRLLGTVNALVADVRGSVKSEDVRQVPPTLPTQGLALGPVLRLGRDDVVLREGHWFGSRVLVEQYRTNVFNRGYAHLIDLKMRLRHESLEAPNAVLHNEGEEYVFVVGSMPPHPLETLRFEEGDEIPLETILRVLATVAQALCVLHSAGFVHRDVTLANVRLLPEQRYALRLTNRLSTTYQCSKQATESDGVPTRWASPEALQVGTYTPEDDIWSYGVLSWELLNGGRAIPYGDWDSVGEVINEIVRGRRLRSPNPLFQSVWGVLAMPCFEARALRPLANDLLTRIREFANGHDIKLP